MRRISSTRRAPVVGAILAAALILAGTAPAGTARAQPLLADEDRATIQNTILEQIEAFGRDDAAAAFAFASPAIQARFGTPDNFMRMVRHGYGPVYRPKLVEFGPLIVEEETSVQRLIVTTLDERLVIADYRMERQPDGAWRIAGVRLIYAGGDGI
ncbi:MAG TPA: DUF4864 domain-containing protein [Alphaproteobacteria bacterium]|nr:DUF4864 domain-containing protein [Alphaproteobacteria bacterium]